MPPADQVRVAVARLVASETFARSERARRLLVYLVDQALAGNSCRLKGFSIAVDVFGRNADFDPASDAVVRVQAGRLRDLLRRYYEGEGVAEPVMISVPRGSYVPDFVSREAAGEAKAEAVADEPPLPSEERSAPALGTGAMLVAFLLMIVLAGSALFYLPSTAPRPPADAAVARSASSGMDFRASVPAQMLPSVRIEQLSSSDAADQIVSLLRLGLAGFDTANLIGRPTVEGAAGDDAWLNFVFSVRHDSAKDAVVVEVENMGSGRLLLSRSLPASVAGSTDAEGLVADLLTTLMPSSGRIYAFLNQTGRDTPLVRCLVLNDRYYRDQNADTHRDALMCLERLMDGDTESPLVYAEAAALHMQTISAGYAYPADTSAAHALRLARRGIELGPGSTYAHRSLGYVLQRSGEAQEALRWMRRAYQLNTYDLTMAASFGYTLIFAGNYEEGTPIISRSVRVTSAHPTWWDFGLFLGAFMLGDEQEAANAAAALAAVDRAHYIAARLIVAAAQGETSEVERLAAHLLERFPRFSDDPLAFFQRAAYPEDMALRLTEALAKAGFGPAG